MDLGKFPRVSVFRLMSPSLCLHVSVSTFSDFYKRKTELTENKLPLISCKRKRRTSIFFAANRNGKRTFVFLGWQKINGN
jgi:hypothetical protein